MADNRIAGTLFIDMKYVFLYHKLGFRETSTDVYKKNYVHSIIVIDSEKQYFEYSGNKYPLTHHPDFVTLELLDLLLCKGYHPDCIYVLESGIRLTGFKEITFRTFTWGNEYEAKVAAEKPLVDQVFYTSQLSGGLIDRKYVASIDGVIYSNGLFEHSKLYDFKPIQPAFLNNCPPEFKLDSTTLVTYKGTDEEVLIPKGVTKIESGAFWNNCRIHTVHIPDTVKVIGGDAFVYCESLKAVNLPESVVDLGDDPFAGCPHLIITNSSKNFVLEDGVLFTSDRTRLIHYQPSLKNREYIIPESVEWVGKHSFYNCNNLKKITIGKNVDFIGNNPFSDCHNLTLINHSSNYIYKDGALLDRHMTTIIHYSHGHNEDGYIMPDTVRTIGRNSFWNCKRIKRIVLGKNLRQIGYNPFANCSNLTIESNSPMYVVVDSILYDKDVREVICCTNVRAKFPVHLPCTVENIGRNSFAGCTSLKSVEIPNSVKSISRGAFSHCESLERVYVPDSVEIIEKWAFSYCYSLKEIDIGSKTKISKETFTGSDKVVVNYR